MTLDGVNPPLLGIFWGVREGSAPFHLATDTTPLDEGERYGDFLTHAGGHFEAWEGWRRLGPAGLAKRNLPKAIAWHEYEHFPRGRVVYHCPTARFIVYADRALQADAVMTRILDAFRLKRAQCDIQSDAHYRSGPRT
jgi:hypothetical protein